MMTRSRRIRPLCCCLATAATVAGSISRRSPSIPSSQQFFSFAEYSQLDPPTLERKRKRRQEYHHLHLSLSSQQFQSDEDDISLPRRLGVTHQKGHDLGENDEPTHYINLGASSEVKTEFITTTDGASIHSEKGSEGDDGGDKGNALNLEPATNIRSFTRIGGSSSIPDRNRYPYMTSLQTEGATPTTGKFDYHVCGGVLIAPDIIMTAAHCAEYNPPGSTEVYQAFNGIEVGRLDLSDEGEAYNEFKLETYQLAYENLIPEKLIKHPQYDQDTYEHDIMLVKIFGVSRYSTVKINSSKSEPQEGSEVTVLGWGAESGTSSKKYSDKMKEATLNVISNSQCESTDVEITDPTLDVTTNMSLRGHIFDDMMCAHASDRFICYGDAGGPVISQGSNFKEDLVLGIISWGYGCVNSEYPVIVTRVSEHYDWIRTIVCNESTDPPEDFSCDQRTEADIASNELQTITLKLKLDMMAVETGFVIVTSPENKVVAQRSPGYYKIKENQILKESMDLPNNQCYKLIMLDSFGDGFCCDLGGGSATLYLGRNTGFKTGQVLVDVDGRFDYYSDGEFCLGSHASSIQSKDPDSSSESAVLAESTSSPVLPPLPSTSQPIRSPTTSFSGWSGPATNPEFEYCNKLCIESNDSVDCGSYQCFHTSDPPISDSQENVLTKNDDSVVEEDVIPVSIESSQVPTSSPFSYEGDASDPGDYFVTVHFQFDEHPEEVSWVLYDLTNDKVDVFVDFDVYTQDEFANQILNIVANIDGPEAGEKQYAFTVYDKMRNGLCCDHGEGFYKLYLGDITDSNELLSGDKYEFSSSYYFTLFQSGNETANVTEMAASSSSKSTPKPTTATVTPSILLTQMPSTEITQAPSMMPSFLPSDQPTLYPTNKPSQSPTRSPSSNPTTGTPSMPWERKRTELMSDIGRRWNSASITSSGKFNDIGGDQRKFDFKVRGAEIANGGSLNRCYFLCASLVFVFMFA